MLLPDSADSSSLLWGYERLLQNFWYTAVAYLDPAYSFCRPVQTYTYDFPSIPFLLKYYSYYQLLVRLKNVVTYNRWIRNRPSRSSPMAELIRETHIEEHGSTLTHWKTTTTQSRWAWKRMSQGMRIFLLFLFGLMPTRHLHLPAECGTDIEESTRIVTTVTSHSRGLPPCQDMSVRPSGRLPSQRRRLSQRWLSFDVGTQAATNALETMPLAPWCLLSLNFPICTFWRY